MSRRPDPSKGVGRRSRPGRPLAAWIIVLVLLAAVAVLVGRTLRPPMPRGGPGAGLARAEVDVFFIRAEAGGRAQTLAAVRRRVPAGGVPSRVEGALRALLDGPSRAERARGLTSEIPPGTVLRSVVVQDRVATVDLSVTFAQGGGSSSILGRVWEVVYTATQFPGVSATQLLIGGRRVDALGGEGFLIGAPLRRPASTPAF